MNVLKNRTITEMAVILLVAAAIGLGLNHKLLRNVLAGKPVQKAAPVSQPAANTSPLPIGLMQAKELFDRQGATFVDARDKESYADGHIKGALSLPLAETDDGMARFKAEVKPQATLVVYCNGFDCHDSIDLGERLIKEGYENVYVFLGGFPEWKDAGYALDGGKS